MAIRFLEEGYEYLDNMSGAQTAGALVYDDGTTMAPWLDRPGAGQNDMIASESLRWMAVTREEIAMIRPPVPRMLFRPEFGYDDTPPTIDAVLDVGMMDVTPRSWAFPPTRTARREFEEDMWSGSIRGGQASGSVNPML